MRFATLALGFALTGCASAPAPQPPPPEPEAPTATVVWSVPMTLENGVPLIVAKVRDGETKFAIGTSSTNNVLTKTFAEQVRAPISTTRVSTKTLGRGAELEKIEGVVSIKAANADWRLEQVVAAESEALDARGIGGILAPQSIATNTTTVVLDFKGGAFTLVEGDAEVFAPWFAGKYGAPQKLPLQRRDGLLLVDVTAGGAATTVAIDSLAARSRFPAKNLGVEIPAGACLEDLFVTGCLPGTATQVESLTVGTFDFPAWSADVTDANPGSLGSDILANCVLAIGVGNDAYAVCE